MILRTLLFATCTFAASAGFAQKACFSDCSKLFANSKTIGHPDSLLHALVGCPAPEIQADDLEGNRVHSKDLKQKVVVINFWFEACKPCIAEVEGLNRMVNEFRDKEVVFLAFGRDQPADIQKFLTKKSFNYQHIPFAGDWADKFCVVAGWPTNLIIDKNGKLALIFSGGRTDEKAPDDVYHRMAPVIRKLLTER
jgi:peroxiredoxin